MILILLFLEISSNFTDPSTLSNYKDIPITYLEGVFSPDFGSKVVSGQLTYTFKPTINGDNIKLDTKYLNITKVVFFF